MTGGEPLYCPYCNALATKQPVLSEMSCLKRWNDELKAMEVRFRCHRCRYQEVWLEQRDHPEV